MFIAIIGTKCSGKSTVEDYLVSSKGFISIHSFRRSLNDHANHLTFSSPEEVLEHITRHWRMNFVTCDLQTLDLVEMFIKRPFFMLMSIDAPLYDRFQRYQKLSNDLDIEDFVRQDDARKFGVAEFEGRVTRNFSLNALDQHVNIRMVNDFAKLSGLHAHVESIDLLNPSHLRPDWDTYFMTLASLASQRSNCMKRRVGAILVRDKRIVATGYNGTPRHLRNCNEGGCPKCNGVVDFKSDLLECVCLHAEENALLEAGRERVGEGAVLYCNTCPCLKCTVKIIQTGVKSVVYNLTYKVDAASARLFKEAGVELRRFDPNVTSQRPSRLESHLDLDGSMFDATPKEWN
ncbi:hypothetical protein K435DRAFT_709550 [Dendrothele bispora CBS 962.96]|uniref:Deoxycytidylate deaminase n=1 Tax=Dendrothele bispora (strain CBS 962.96) TaxID=1314807 RepID=A0A4S8MWH8_DENBC|nr:hypothetical protein K435DRAFT_709550 [Dendrothele bispora CBS 962.96]